MSIFKTRQVAHLPDRVMLVFYVHCTTNDLKSIIIESVQIQITSQYCNMEGSITDAFNIP